MSVNVSDGVGPVKGAHGIHRRVRDDCVRRESLILLENTVAHPALQWHPSRCSWCQLSSSARYPSAGSRVLGRNPVSAAEVVFDARVAPPTTTSAQIFLLACCTVLHTRTCRFLDADLHSHTLVPPPSGLPAQSSTEESDTLPSGRPLTGQSPRGRPAAPHPQQPVTPGGPPSLAPVPPSEPFPGFAPPSLRRPTRHPMVFLGLSADMPPRKPAVPSAPRLEEPDSRSVPRQPAVLAAAVTAPQFELLV